MVLKKRFGQHFLKDEKDAKRIANSLQNWGEEYVSLVEIGPGAGALTKFLVEKATNDKELTLIEIDRDLIQHLEERYGSANVKVLNVDFLKADLKEIKAPFGICGNFPYNISSQILFRVLQYKSSVPELVGMFQKEVAQRVAATHGSKTYGILSVLVQAYYDVTPVFTLKPGAFNPPPKVDSMVIHLNRIRTSIADIDESKFFKVVKAAFGQRRKTLRNSLKMFLDERKLDELQDGILQLRPEQLSVAEFVELTKKIS